MEEDVDGNFHYHDRNGRWQEWKCSKGHVFKCVAYNHCWCGWSSQYPGLCDVQFKPRKEVKGFKFAQKIAILNNKHIDLIVRKQNADNSRDSSDECCNRGDNLCMHDDKNSNGAINVRTEPGGVEKITPITNRIQHKEEQDA